MTELIDRDDISNFFHNLLDSITIPKYLFKKPAGFNENKYIIIGCLPISIHYNYAMLEPLGYERINNQYIKENEPPIPIKILSHGHLESHLMILSEANMESNMIIQYCAKVNINYHVRNISKGEPDNSKIYEGAELIKKALQGVSTSNYIIQYIGEELYPEGRYSWLNLSFQFLLIHS